MPRNLRDFSRHVEARARAQGPAAEAELAAIRTQARIARLLADGRLARGLTQQQLAQSSGIPQSEISKIENARANPTVATLAALSRPLGLELDVRPSGSASMLAALSWSASEPITPSPAAPAFRRPKPTRLLHLAA